MRTSEYFIKTTKETPSDAEVISHQLMLRAGMIRKLASGLYTWLPLGLRVLRKVANIVREEMDNAGAVECLMPAVQPAELWQESGRWEQYGPELLRMQDRHGRDFCFGPTHEEVITDLIRHTVQSYKELPLTLYQIQTKFRDEIRPRFGILRAREFLMKDAYSFNIDAKSLQTTYDSMYKAYCQIFERCGLNFRAVLADTGSIGGNASHEFHVLADTGEDQIFYSDQSDYAANRELATSLVPDIEPATDGPEKTKVSTPGIQKVAAQCEHLNIPSDKMLKTLLVKGTDHDCVALVLRGNDKLNPLKAEKLPQVAAPLTFIDDVQLQKLANCAPGFVGPIGLDVPILVDHNAACLSDFTCGANETDHHWQHVHWQRDLPLPECVDLRNVIAGDPSPDGKGSLKMLRGIEVGHIFQLGDKYSKAMNLTVLDETGRKTTPLMGCYGIGVSRILGAAIEQNHDDRGMIWPDNLAPFQIAIVPIQLHKSQRVRDAVETLYQQLTAAGFDVLLDDRNERPGALFADVDLIGIPHRLVLGERALDAGEIEYKHRRDTDAQLIKLDNVIEFMKSI